MIEFLNYYFDVRDLITARRVVSDKGYEQVLIYLKTSPMIADPYIIKIRIDCDENHTPDELWRELLSKIEQQKEKNSNDA